MGKRHKVTIPAPSSERRRDSGRHVLVFISVALGLGTLVLFWPVSGYGFVGYDDSDYFAENPYVIRGITWRGLIWAFKTMHAANWHPLTWLSLMLNAALFGKSAGALHLVNVVLHGLNSVLLFWALRGLTGAIWRSAFIAALFAWHPMHVESVVWIAERKDVLSGLFFILTLLAYARYSSTAPKPNAEHWILNTFSQRWYWAALVLFALGLMSKPMLVTVPFVLLLLDYWPLKSNAECRIAEHKNAVCRLVAIAAGKTAVFHFERRGLRDDANRPAKSGLHPTARQVLGN